mmetsp:Transcript_17534/g.68014  ORF Transcript_17534/g.68014 Transcript_17534/m.68014 type:complete len:678 (-) Transcript_17534:43-2076(-)
MAKSALFVLIALVVVCTFAGHAAGSQITNIKEADCGWVGISEEECVGAGCVWIPNFAGPWCQYAHSPFVPGNIYFGIHSKINEYQQTVLLFAGATLLSIVGFLYVYSFVDEREASSSFLSTDSIGAAILLAVSMVSRFWKLEMPGEVAFDEFYFGSFANWYCNQVYVFDIHPPLAKLTHWILGTWLGHECTFDFTAEAPNDKYHSLEQYVHMREVSALFGALVVPLGYLLARRIGLSYAASMVVAAMLFSDTLLLSETRLILTDSQLFFYTVLSLYCAFRLWQSNGRESKLKTSFWVVATAISCGCAFSVKFTALATLGWITFVSITSFYPYSKPLSVRQCMAGAIIGLVVLCVPFYIHFQRGVYSGTGDWNLDLEHQALLKGNQHYNPRARPPSFFRHLYYLVDRMIEQNRLSLGSHPYASFWYQWLRGRGALLAYSEHHDEEDFHAHIFIIGNMVVAHSVLVAIALFAAIGLWLVRLRFWYRLSARHWTFVLNGSIFIFGWFAHLAPYALVERTTYSYHYLAAQFYGMIVTAVVLDFIAEAIALFVAQMLRPTPPPAKASAQPSATETETETTAEAKAKTLAKAKAEKKEKAAGVRLPDKEEDLTVPAVEEGPMPALPRALYLGDLEWIRLLLAAAFITAVLWSYYFFSPFAYGYPITQFEFAMRNFIIDQGVGG